MGNIYTGNGNICPICGIGNVDINSSGADDKFYHYCCPNCDCFFVPNSFRIKLGEAKFSFDVEHLKKYLFYHPHGRLRPVLCDKEYYNSNVTAEYVEVFNITPEMVENWYPHSFAEKVDLILQKLDDISEYDGAHIQIKDNAEELFFCEKAKVSEDMNKENANTIQKEYMNDFLEKNGYVKNFGDFTYQLLPKALERIYELRKNYSNNKNVFVSMAFNDGTKQTREAIRTAIVSSGYSPEFIDEIIHNRQIVPEMFRLIRECKFLILDISDPNYGAYYEAGYALGLGKEVIICCSNEVFSKDFGTEAKYRKPHFDIAQKQLLIWDDYDDLIKKLTEWIKAIVR